MKYVIKISDFLKTGKFGTVEFNDSIEIVIKKLGQPNGGLNPDILKLRKGIHYSMYEFIFFEDKLESIQNDHFDTASPEKMEFENNQILIKPELIKADKKKNMKDIANELDSLNIGFEVIDYWGRKVIKTIGQVIIDFNDEMWSDKEKNWIKIKKKEDYELIGIRYYPKE